MTSGSNGVGAFNATVRVNEPGHIVQAARVQRASDCAAAVEHIETKLAALEAERHPDLSYMTKRMAALQAALEAAQAEAEQARREAQEGDL